EGMRRGGPRRRWAPSHDRRVYCSGRWGPRRVRVTECCWILKAEAVYAARRRDDAAPVAPGARGTATYTVEGRQFTASWEIRQNAVWRRGRVFLRCPRCCSRGTRLYVPTSESWLACPQCWGLTYPSRTLQNYKNSLWGSRFFAKWFGVSQRDCAFERTDNNRIEHERSRKRWNKRRHYTA